jgi:hypothetical protein
MNVWSPSDSLFNQIGYGHGGLSTGNRGNVVFRNIQTGKLQQPYGQPAVPPPGQQFRGQSPFYRTGSGWGAYTHSSFVMGDDNNSFRFTYDKNGAIIGNEWNLSPSAVIGGVAQLNEGKLNSRSDKTTSFDYNFGLYAVAAPFEQFEVKSFTGFGFQSYKMDRYIRNNDVFIGGGAGAGVFGINEHYDSETLGYSFNHSLEFARPFTVSPNFVIRPVAGFEYQNMRQNAFTEQMNEGSSMSWSNSGTNLAGDYLAQGETSGTYGMDFRRMKFSRSLLRIGLNTESYFARGGWQFRAYHVARLAGDRTPVSRQSFSSGSDIFKVRAGDLGNSYAQLGMGSHYWLNQERTATLFMNGDWNFSIINNGYSRLGVDIGVQVGF